jgi:hypothetical protein
MILDDGTVFDSIERPWKDNHHGISCIPTGTYKCTWFDSPKHGWCYLVNDVPERSDIEIHSANWSWQLLGCIAIGKGRDILNGEQAILKSKDAVNQFDLNMNMASFTLEII